MVVEQNSTMPQFWLLQHNHSQLTSMVPSFCWKDRVALCSLVEYKASYTFHKKWTSSEVLRKFPSSWFQSIWMELREWPINKFIEISDLTTFRSANRKKKIPNPNEERKQKLRSSLNTNCHPQWPSIAKCAYIHIHLSEKFSTLQSKLSWKELRG